MRFNNWLSTRSTVAKVFAPSLFLGMTTLAVAESLPAKFTLGQYLPGDVWFYVHVVDNPERAWINAKWAAVFEEAKSRGLDRDLAELILATLPPDRRAELEPKLDRIMNALRSVPWSELSGREFAMAERLAGSKITNDYILLVRTADGAAERSFTSLVAVLKEVATMGPGIEIREKTEGGVQRASMHLAEKNLAEMGFAIELFRRNDIIGFASGSRATADVIAMLGKKAPTESLVQSARFRQAVAMVEAPTDSLVFVDTKQLMVDVRQIIETAAAMQLAQQTDGQPEECEKKQRAAAIQAKLRGVTDEAFALADVMDFVIETASLRGRKDHTDSVMKFQAGKQNSPLAAAFLKRRAFDNFDRYIPASATGFSLSTAVDLERLYRVLVSVLNRHFPEGAAKLAQAHLELANRFGFEIERDFFSWYSGESISVTLPAAFVSPFGGSDSVTFLRVKDGKLALEKTNAAVDFLVNTLKGFGHTLTVSPASVSVEGFREITYAPMAAFVRPVVGVHEDWLILGNSAGAINKCLAVRSGEAPSIVGNTKFVEEGVTPKGPVTAASFKDTSKMGQEMAAMAAMVGSFGAMFVAQIPEKNDDAKKFKQFAQSCLRIAGKLGPVLQKMDFYSSSSSMSVYDGELVVRSTKVTTYKPQPAEANTKPAK